MTYQLVSTESGMVHNLHCVEIVRYNVLGLPMMPLTFYVEQTHADVNAIELSRSFPDAEVRIVFMSRIKATYKNGVRTSLQNIEDFYTGLNEEEIKASRLLVGAGEWR